MSIKDLINECLKLQTAYGATTRTVITPHNYNRFVLPGFIKPNDHRNRDVTEPLIEHVGHLPILASFWHPYIQHSNKVDLGRALTMLAIHDIGETVLGDINSYHKTINDEQQEVAMAMKLLHPSLQKYFIEYEAQETYDAKFARSIDGFAVEMACLSIPKIAISRARRLEFTIEDVIQKKRPRMEWDAVLLEVFDLMVKHYSQVANGGEPIFNTELYDRE